MRWIFTSFPFFLVLAHAFSTTPRGDRAITSVFALSLPRRLAITNTG